MRNIISQLKNLFMAALVLALLLQSLPQVKGAGNHLDYGFSGDGKMLTGFGSIFNATIDKGNEVAVQSNGKIVVVGSTRPNDDYEVNFAVARYDSDGTLDTTFGSGGKVITDFGGTDHAYGVAIQTDGKIVVVGSSHPGIGSNFAIARYTTSGRLDTTFDGDGKLLIDNGGSETARAVALQTDGKIVMAGDSQPFGGGNLFMLVRLNTNGMLDNTFDGNGKLTITFGDGGYTGAQDVLTQTDGKIVACGGGETANRDMALARFNSDGSLDTSFGGDGKVTTDFMAREDSALAIKRLSSGKYVVAGYARDNTATASIALARYNQNGTLDTTFDGDGKVVTPPTTDLGERATDLVLTSSGDIYVTVDSTGVSSSSVNHFTLLRYFSNGTLDDSFGTGGRVITIFGDGDGTAEAIALQSNGRVVAVGTYDPEEGYEKIAVARYNARGISARADFGGAGQADYAVYRPSNSTWYIQDSTTGAFNFVTWGTAGDIPVPGDYDGDSITDAAVFRPSDGTWYVRQSASQTSLSFQFGISTDTPVQGDYDGDGRTDYGVFRPSTGTWYIERSTLGSYTVAYGSSADIPAQGDYDGDGKTDVAYFSPSTGVWNLKRSALGTTTVAFGLSGDTPVQGDYDGDGITDMAVFRPADSTWYIKNSEKNNSTTTVQWGNSTDIPAAADFDADGLMDIAVFRPSDGYWYVLMSTTGNPFSLQFGQADDVPISSAYAPQ